MEKIEYQPFEHCTYLTNSIIKEQGEMEDLQRRQRLHRSQFIVQIAQNIFVQVRDDELLHKFLVLPVYERNEEKTKMEKVMYPWETYQEIKPMELIAYTLQKFSWQKEKVSFGPEISVLAKADLDNIGCETVDHLKMIIEEIAKRTKNFLRFKYVMERKDGFYLLAYEKWTYRWP